MPDPIRPFLASLDRDALVDLIVEEAVRDDGLAERLGLRAAMAAPGTDGLPAMKKAIGRATRTYGFLRYRDVRAFTRGVDEVADLLDGLVTDGRPDAAIGLAEHALARLEKALDHADDSDGLIGDLLARFQRTHLDACRAARPDPEKLAERLFRWELSDDWDVFRGAAETYAEVLGEAGLARYRHLAEAEWERLPTLAPVQEGIELHDSGRFTVTYMMESLAHAFHDVDMEIAVRSRDLSSAYRFLEIAQVCRDAGRPDEALDWAERGVRAFPERTDHRLREFMADEYLRRARGDDAMAVIWAQFHEQPALAAFQLLKRYADQIGTWAPWRSRALAEVRRSIDQAKAAGPTPARIGRARYRWDLPPDGSRLVDILLWERHVDEAWSEAHALGCSPGLLLLLAAERQATHPDDAIPIYRQEVERLLQVSDKGNYAQAVELLGRIGPLMSRLGRATEFASYLADIRAANARRPAFTSLLDAAQLAPRRPVLRALD
jgi:tetratricopeptide (TPR) repeat protein